MCFIKFLFHLLEVAVGIDFAREKNLFLTGFTHCKTGLWKSCELGLKKKLLVNRVYYSLSLIKSAVSILKNAICPDTVFEFISNRII